MKSARIMMAYAVFLVICGLVAYFSAPPTAKATTALVIPSVFAFLMVICAVMTSSFYRNQRIGMIGIHAGLVLPLLFACALAVRAYNTFNTGGMEKRYLAYVLAVMTLGSVIAFFTILKMRPAKELRN